MLKKYKILRLRKIHRVLERIANSLEEFNSKKNAEFKHPCKRILRTVLWRLLIYILFDQIG